MTVDCFWMPEAQAVPIGVSLKTDYFDHILAARPKLAFFEVHAENYMTEGGAHHRYLEEIGQHYALSVHGVGMSLGSAEGIDPAHVARFRQVIERHKPALVSEHLAWSVEGGTYLNDLLPLPLTEESLAVVTDNVNRLQDAIGRTILIENPSSYLAFKSSTIEEGEFLARLAEATSCGLLLDVNNIYVSACNMGFDAAAYLDAVPAAFIGEVHLAGHTVKDIDGTSLHIDDHGSQVCDAVWQLYDRLIDRVGARPTLIEWDSDIPPFDVLEAEAAKAGRRMTERQPAHA